VNREYYTDRGLEFLSRCYELDNLSIGSIGITDAGMEQVAKLINLKSLSIFACDNITDRGYAKLVTLKSLEKLTIYSEGITIAGLNQLNSLSGVKMLHVSGLRRGGAVLNLSGMSSLHDVMLDFQHRSDEAFADADLACLKDLKKLTGLQMGPRTFSDSGLRYLSGLTEVKSLSVGGPELTDAGIRHLAAMEQLGMLNVLSTSGDAKLTDETLRFLERFKLLGVVRITSDIPFSQDAVRHLRKELPKLYLAQIQPTSSTACSSRVRGNGTSSSRRR